LSSEGAWVTPAVLLAAAAGVLAAAGIVELAAAGRPRPAGLPITLISALARVGRRLGAPRAPRDLATRVAAAGAPLALDVPDVMAVKGGSAVVALLAGSPLASALPGRLPVVGLAALPLLGFFAPDLLLARRIRARAQRMEAELPDLLDLLRIAVEAGLSLGRALGDVGARHGGLLAAEWSRAAAEIALGVPRARALDELAARCPVPGMPALVAAVDRAQRHGAPLAETLAAQALQARAARSQRIRERAARAAPKIQLVIALLLVPSVLLLVAAALLASLTG
jgi:tight adherence protein C